MEIQRVAGNLTWKWDGGSLCLWCFPHVNRQEESERGTRRSVILAQLPGLREAPSPCFLAASVRTKGLANCTLVHKRGQNAFYLHFIDLSKSYGCTELQSTTGMQSYHRTRRAGNTWCPALNYNTCLCKCFLLIKKIYGSGLCKVFSQIPINFGISCFCSCLAVNSLWLCLNFICNFRDNFCLYIHTF